jgi:hypothetical protein
VAHANGPKLCGEMPIALMKDDSPRSRTVTVSFQITPSRLEVKEFLTFSNLPDSESPASDQKPCFSARISGHRHKGDGRKTSKK